MLYNRQSAVVDSALLELLKRNEKGAAKTQGKTVLALLFFHMNGMNEGLQGLRELHENNINIRLCPDESILEHYTVTEISREVGTDDFVTIDSLEEQMDDIDHIFIPILPFSTVSDLLNFNDVRTSIRILLWALMSGKKVTAFSGGADPYHRIWKEADLDHGTNILKRKMKQQLLQMKGLGIELIEKENDLLSHFNTVLHHERSQIITADTMERQAKEGIKYIEISKGTIITPLARDIARKYHIEIGNSRGG